MKKFMLVYQSGIANVFEVEYFSLSPEYRKEQAWRYQSSFKDCESYALGILAGGNATLKLAWCNMPGDIRSFHWRSDLEEAPFYSSMSEYLQSVCNCKMEVEEVEEVEEEEESEEVKTCLDDIPEKTILEKAAEIVDGNREQTYGGPEESFPSIAKAWSAILRNEVTAEQVTLCMAALKLIRLSYNPKHEDSQVDACGYMRLLERIVKHK